MIAERNPKKLEANCHSDAYWQVCVHACVGVLRCSCANHYICKTYFPETTVLQEKFTYILTSCLLYLLKEQIAFAANTEFNY